MTDRKFICSCTGAVLAGFALTVSANAGVCPNPDHDCFTTGTVGCSDQECCETVCAVDPFCCDTSWDSICVGEAIDLCAGEGPNNDLCENARVITDGDTAFSTIGATTDGPALPPECEEGFGLAFVNDIWFQYTASATGTLVISTCNQASYDTRLAAYSGFECFGELIDCNDDFAGCSGFTSRMELNVVAGDEILIRVGGFSTSGTGTLTVGVECGCNPDCPADFDGNGQVDGADLGELLARWGATSGNCADLDCNGLIDGADLGSLLAQWGPCPKVSLCPPAANDCCTPGGPGCSDTECCDTVCAVDPFCCETAWDSICIDEAQDLCGLECPSACDSADHDCTTTGGPGCTDIECCETVCGVDPFCCQTAWDSICVDEVFVFCVECDVECPAGSTDEGEPCGENTNGGCNTSPDGPFGSIACGETICGTGWALGGTRDTDWFEITVDTATEIVLTCEAEFPVLFGVIDTGGVPDCALAAFVDPFAIANPCTETQVVACLTPGTWWIFVAPATFDGFPCDGNNTYWINMECGGKCEIPNPCDFATNDCCTTGGPGCSDADCCNAICAIDPFCCDTAWDSICVGEAVDICGLECPSVCEAADHDCFTTGNPGCSDIECCELVCSLDPFCCNTAWDSICVDEAIANCDG